MQPRVGHWHPARRLCPDLSSSCTGRRQSSASLRLGQLHYLVRRVEYARVAAPRFDGIHQYTSSVRSCKEGLRAQLGAFGNKARSACSIGALSFEQSSYSRRWCGRSWERDGSKHARVPGLSGGLCSHLLGRLSLLWILSAPACHTPLLQPKEVRAAVQREPHTGPVCTSARAGAHACGGPLPPACMQACGSACQAAQACTLAHAGTSEAKACTGGPSACLEACCLGSLRCTG